MPNHSQKVKGGGVLVSQPHPPVLGLVLLQRPRTQIWLAGHCPWVSHFPVLVPPSEGGLLVPHWQVSQRDPSVAQDCAPWVLPGQKHCWVEPGVQTGVPLHWQVS